MAGKRSLHLRFGGWGSYQEWAEHGFTPKSTQDRSAKPGGRAAAEPAARTGTEPPAAPAAGPAHAPTGPALGPSAQPAAADGADGARKASPAGDRSPAPSPPPEPRPARRAYGPPVPPRPQPVGLFPAPPEVNRPDEPLIRPYILTGGRTRPRHDLDVHALIRTTERGRTTTRALPAEQETIRRLCRSAWSLAEVAALVHVPLGVARILIDDMEGQDLVAVTLPPQEDEHSVELLTRVLAGLRDL